MARSGRHGLLDKHPSQSAIGGQATEERVYKQREIYNLFGKKRWAIFLVVELGSYGGFHLFTIKQARIRAILGINV